MCPSVTQAAFEDHFFFNAPEVDDNDSGSSRGDINNTESISGPGISRTKPIWLLDQQEATIIYPMKYGWWLSNAVAQMASCAQRLILTSSAYPGYHVSQTARSGGGLRWPGTRIRQSKLPTRPLLVKSVHYQIQAGVQGCFFCLIESFRKIWADPRGQKRANKERKKGCVKKVLCCSTT